MLLNLDSKCTLELLGLHLGFVKFTIEKVDSCTQVVPDTLKCCPVFELNISFKILNGFK